MFEVTLSDDDTGSFTFTLHDNLDHAPGANENDLSLSFNYSARDSDGDVANGSFVVGVDDDMPIVGENAVVYTDDETATSPDAAPNDGGTGDYDGANPPASLNGTLAHTYGADGAGSTLLLTTNPTPGFTYTLSDGGQTLTISQLQDGVSVDVLRVTLTDTTSGNYTVEQLNEIDHSEPGTTEENLLLNVNYRVTDGDGDSVDGQLTINVDDDTPTVVADDICEDIPTEPGDVANFVLVLDTSGSIESNQLSLVQDAVENLLNQIGSSGAQDVRIHIVEFSTGASVVGTYDIISGGSLNAAALADAIADVNALGSGGSTNYEAGFQQALQFIQGGSQTIPVDDLISSPDANGGASDGTTRLVGHDGQHIALISGWNSPGTTSGSLINANGSTSSGWGASDGSNDQIDPGQLVRVDFGAFDNFSVGSFGNPGGFSGVPVLSATFTLQDNSGGGSSTNFTYTIHFADGSPAQSNTVNVGSSTDVTLAGTGGNLGREIAYIEFTVGSGDEGDVDLQSIVTMPATPGTLPNADVNSLIFISDGNPNEANDDNGAAISVNAQTAINHILGIADGSNEVGNTETDGDGPGLDQAFTIEAFHVGSPTTTLNVNNLISSYDANSAGGGGTNDTARIIGNGSTQIALVSGWVSPGTANGEMEDVEESNGDGIDDGWGIDAVGDDDNVESPELLRFDFGSFNNFGVANYTSGGFSGINVTSATFTLDDNNGSGTTTFNYTVHFVGGGTQSGSNTVNGSTNVTLTGTGGNAGAQIAYIEFTVSGGGASGDIDLQSVVTPAPGLALLDQVEGTGGDADSLTAPGDLANSLSALIASLAGTPGNEGDCGPIVVHDETSAVQGAADPNAQDDVTGSTQVIGTTTIAALFAGVTFAGTDADATSLDSGAIGFARSGANNAPVEFEASFGADGPAATNSIVHTLSIPGGAAGNGTVDSGLDTTDGHSIYLFQENGLIVGRVDADNSGSASATDPAAFAIAINPTTGELYVAQYLSLDHPTEGNGTTPPGSFDEQVVLANDAIRVTVTITDHDGDQASSAAISIGKYIGFQDDGPSIDVTATNEASVVLTTQDAETDGVPTSEDTAVSTANFSGVFAIGSQAFGTDGAGTAPVLGYALSLFGSNGVNSTLDSNGASIFLHNIGGVVTGSTTSVAANVNSGNTIFTIAVNGSGVVTLTQFAEIDHANNGDTSAPYDDQFAVLNTGLVRLTASATITDGDGDTATDSAFIDLGGNIRFADDGPSLDVTATNEANVVLTTQDAETDGVPTSQDTAVSAANFSGVFAIASQSFGADGPGTAPVLNYALSLTVSEGTPSGLASNGATIRLYINGNVITGSTAGSEGGVNSGNTIFTIAVNGSGVVTLTQFAEIDHANNGDTSAPYDDQFAVLNTGLVRLTASATITDQEGDSATDSAFIDLGGNIRFADDGPSVNVTATNEASVVLTTQDAETDGVPTSQDTATSAANFSGVFAIASQSFGADGPGTAPVLGYALSLTVAEGADSGFDSNGVQINLYTVGGVIVGSTALVAPATATDPSVAFSIAVNGSGVVTLTQFAEIDHANNGDTSAPYDDQFAVLNTGLVRLTASATITDEEGDSATDSAFIDLGGNIRFADDGPSVNVTATNEASVVLTTQDAETDGVPTSEDTAVSAANFSGVFAIASQAFGADGPGTAPVLSYALGLTVSEGASSGLASNGATIRLYINGNVITGSTAGSEGAVNSGNTIFTIAVNGSGVVTLTQFAEIDHANNGDTSAPYDDQFAVLNTGLVRLTASATITDGDGDTATDSAFIDLGGNIRFADDGPSLDVTATNEANVVLTTQDAETDGVPTSQDTAVSAANFSGVFAVASQSFGADGPGTAPVLNYALSLTVSEGTPSGLASNGATIRLYINGNVITGSTAGSEGGVNSGNTIFTIAVNGSGVVTLTQFAEIDHANNGDTSAPYDDQFAVLDTGLVRLTASATITDQEGDSATDNAFIDLGGNIRFADDGPSVAPNATVYTDDETATAPDATPNLGGTDDYAGSPAANLTGTLMHSYGADGAGTTLLLDTNPTSGFTYVLSSGGQVLTIRQLQDGNLIDVVRVTLTNATSGAYTVEQLNEIDHSIPGASEENLDLNVSYLVTDGDGDTAEGVLTINVDDDTPVMDSRICLVSGGIEGANPADLLYTLPPGAGLRIDVSDLISDAANQNSLGYYFFNASGEPISGAILSDHAGNPSNEDILVNLAAGSVPAGAVGLGFFIIPDGNDLNSGLADGDAITFQLVGSQWQAFVGSSQLATGQGSILFSDRRLNPDDGDADANPDDFEQAAPNAPGSVRKSNWEDVIDGDNDFNDVQFNIEVCATANLVVTVDEDGLPGHAVDAGRLGEVAGSGLATASGAAGALAALVSFGADGPHPTQAFSLATALVPVPTGLTSQGGAVLIVSDGTTLTGYVELAGAGSGFGAGDRAVFTFTVGANGSYNFTLLDQIDHPTLDGLPGDNTENLLASAIDLSGYIIAKDHDGDTLTLAAGAFQIQVRDDIPFASGTKLTGQVDEDEMNGSPFNDNSVGIQDAGPETDEITFTAAQVNSLINAATAGADQPVTVVLNMGVSGQVLNVAGGDVRSHGELVLFGTVGSEIVGYVNVGGGAGFQAGTDREVFRVTLNNDGSITFDLRDQLDHSNPQNLPLGPGESALIELNLSPALLIQDFDGDTTALPPGLFTVSVENDIPANTALFVQVGVGEDEMSQAPGTLPTPDLSTGNGSSAFGSDEVIITNVQLQTLVQPGADEEVLFSLNTALGGNVFTVNNENVEYLNQNVRFGYDSATQTIVGFVDENVSNGTYEAGDHVVFRLTALPGGNFRFDLLDQLDHNIFNTSGTGDARTLTIDLSGAIVATDFDGDVVNLGVDSIRVVVENDVPSLVVNPARRAARRRRDEFRHRRDPAPSRTSSSSILARTSRPPSRTTPCRPRAGRAACSTR